MIVVNGLSLLNAEIAATTKALLCRDSGVTVKVGSSDGSTFKHPNYRCFYVSNQLDTPDRLNTVKGYVEAAAKVGFNVMMLSNSYFDNMINASQTVKNNMLSLKQYCKEWGVDIAPICFSVGYGGGYTSKPINKNFAASYPCRLGFVIQEGQAIVVPEQDLACKTIDFESCIGNSFSDFIVQDGAGVISFLDTSDSHSGTKSCRFTDVQSLNGYGRLVVQINTEQNKSYEVSFWAKCSSDWPGQKITLQATQTGTTRTLMSISKVPTDEWGEYKLQFNSLDCAQINIAMGVWGGTSGSFWIDDIVVKRQEILQMVVQRDKTLFSVKNKTNSKKYVQGIDYTLNTVLGFPNMTYELIPRTIPEGSEIVVDYYRSYWRDSWGGTHALCVDADEVQSHFDNQTQAIYDLLQPKIWQFSTDEIRQGGYDAESIHKDQRDSIGQHLNKRKAKICSLNPSSILLTSGDMFDPSMNAVTPYCSSKGFANSWLSLNKSIKPNVWSFAEREEGLSHFMGNNFEPFMSINIDECSTTADLQAWKTSLDNIGFEGIIRYTTWVNNYTRLSEFSDVFFA